MVATESGMDKIHLSAKNLDFTPWKSSTKIDIPTKTWPYPSKIEWDLTNGPLSKLLELLDIQVEGFVQWVLLEISWTIG